MITLTTYQDARDAFRRRDLRQALYDQGHHLMSGVIVNLHGDEHIARRRLENRLFRRDTFAWYEAERLPAIIDAHLQPRLAEGRAELRTLARHTMLTLSVEVAGVDLPDGRGGELDAFYRLMDRLAHASTVGDARGDKDAIIADGDAALAEFEQAFYQPSLARRLALLDQVASGQLSEADLPRDVFTTLLRNHDNLDLDPATLLREVAYYPWVGSHSTSNQFVHAMHHIFEWLTERPDERTRLCDDAVVLQRFVHESMRLHPASPIALRRATVDTTLPAGEAVRAGDLVTIDLVAANRDPSAVGAEPDHFDPFRERAEGVAPWGLSFGHGTHACLGQELAGGLDPLVGDAEGRHLSGVIVLLAGAVLRAGAAPDPHDPATLDATTTRVMWGRYPVRFR